METATENNAEYPYKGILLPDCSVAKDSIFHNLDEYNQWIEEIPIASPLESAKAVFKALFDMNRTELNSETRMNGLEALLTPVGQFTQGLLGRYNATTFPMSEKNYKIALLVREIFLELVIGYKHIITEHIEKSEVNNKRNMHSIAIHRMMHFLNQVLFNSYLIYESYPKHTWLELHMLFTYSSINKLDLLPVEIKLANETSRTFTARQLYVKAILLSAASPYQLRQREMMILFDKLDGYTSWVKLSVNKEEKLSSGFIINLHSDKPPLHISSGQNAMGKQFFILQTAALIEQIKQSQIDEGLVISDHLKLILLRNWGEAPQRKYVRTKLNFDLKIAAGLNEIHQLVVGTTGRHLPKSLLTRSKTERESLKRTSLFDTSTLEEDLSVLTIESTNSTGREQGNYLSSGPVENRHDVDASDLIEDMPEKPENIHDCKTVNESTGGYCIDWPQSNAPKVRVGELIGIQSAVKHQDFALSIARWLKCLPNNQILVGIELISQSCQAVEVRPDKVIAKHKTIEYFPALIFSKPSQESDYIIVPANKFNPDDRLLIKQKDGSQKKAKLSKLIESTGIFSRYICKAIN